MKQIVSILILLTILFQSVSKLGYIIHYSINKDFIAKNQCENRNKPKANCNGKCQLKKQLNQAEKNESQGKTDSKEKWEDLFFTSLPEFFGNTNSGNCNYFVYRADVSVNHFPSIYHPPKA